MIKEFYQTISQLTSSVNVHLTLDQIFVVRTPSIFIRLEKIRIGSLSNRMIQLDGNGRIHFPFFVNLSRDRNQIITIQVNPLIVLENFEENFMFSR